MTSGPKLAQCQIRVDEITEFAESSLEAAVKNKSGATPKFFPRRGGREQNIVELNLRVLMQERRNKKQQLDTKVSQKFPPIWA
jgi:hypothetical protein